MNINIVIAVDNEINNEGLTSIIQNGILGSNVLKIDKENLINKIHSNFFEMGIVEIRKKENNDYLLLTQLAKIITRTKIFVFVSKDVESKIVKLIKNSNIEIILCSDTTATITKKLNFHLRYHKRKNVFRKRKMNKLKSLDNLLSNRELEIGTMLIKGYSISYIASKKNLAMSTVSTYKRRIFEKTKVNNLIEMANVFKKYQHQI